MINKPLRTVFVVKSILDAGKRKHEMVPYQLGLFDESTDLSVNVATYCQDKLYRFYWKSPSEGSPTPFFGDERNAKLPLKSTPISRIKRKFAFENANGIPVPQVSYLGWDGVSPCNSLKFECGKTYGLQITARGRNVRDVHGRNFTEVVSFNTGCCDGCSLDEGCEKVVDSIMKAINTESFYLANRFFKAEKVKSCCEAATPFARTIFERYRLRVPDTGDSHALAAVQNQYSFPVTRVAREGVDSIYEVVVKKIPTPTLTVISVTATGNATLNRRHNVNASLASVVLTIPASTGVNDVIEVVNVGLTNNTVTTVGGYSGSVATGDGLRLVGNGSGGWLVRAFNTFANYTTTGLTIADCEDCPTGFTLQEGYDSYIVNVNGDQSFDPLTFVSGTYTSVQEAKILGVINGRSTIQFRVTAGAAQVQAPGHVLTALGSTGSYCLSDTTQSFSWYKDSEAYKVSRKLCVTRAIPDCGDLLSETNLFVAFATTLPDYVAGSAAVNLAGDCVAQYSLEQYNNSLLEDGCDTFGKDGAKFDRIQSFDSFVLEPCGCDGWTFDVDGCPIAPPEAGLEDCRCGIKFTTSFYDQTTDACYFNPTDALLVDPIELEVQIISPDIDYCDIPQIPFRVVQHPQIVQGLGQFVLRDVIKNRYYDNYLFVDADMENSQRLTKVLGYDFGVDVTKLYHHFNLVHNSTIERDSFVSDSPIMEEIVLYVEAANIPLQNQLKMFLNGTLLSGGVCELFQ